MLYLLLLPLMAAFVVRALPDRWRLPGFIGTLCTVFAGTLAICFHPVSLSLPGICGLGLSFRADGFRGLYAVLCAFMWLVTGLLTPEYFRHDRQLPRYLFFNLVTLAATLGVFYADDLFSTLVCFEVMSLASYVWVIQEEEPQAMRAGQTYLAVAVIGGLTTLMGLFLLWKNLGTLRYDELQAAAAAFEGPRSTISWASWLTLFGFAAKAGLFPIHIWLPKAHPVAPAPASAILSGMLTKTGVLGMAVVALRINHGNADFANALLVLGAVTMFLGAVLGLFSVNLKRTLACSSVSQIGFIVCGLSLTLLLGHHGTIAAYGTVLHMVNHSLCKLCLFLCAGTVFMNLEELDLNKIRGFGKGKPLLHIVFLAGALSIACIPPLGAGFNSKSLLHEGILEYMEVLEEAGSGAWGWYKAFEILFLISGGLTVAYMTKLYICLFREEGPASGKPSGRKYATRLSAAALILSCAALPLLGLFGRELMSPLAARSMSFFGPEEKEIFYFTWENLKGALISIGIGAAVYLVVVRCFLMRRENGKKVYVNRWPAWLDLEEAVYRPVLKWLPILLGKADAFVMGIPDSKAVTRWIPHGIGRITAFVMRLPESAAVLRVIPEGIGRMTEFAMHLPESFAVLRAVPAGIIAVSRFVCEIPERLASLMHRSLFRKAKPKKQVPVGNAFTYRLGCFLNRCTGLLNRTVWRGRPLRQDFEYVLARRRQEAAEEQERIMSSVSYGFLLMLIGIVIVVVVLLAHRT